MHRHQPFPAAAATVHVYLAAHRRDASATLSGRVAVINAAHTPPPEYGFTLVAPGDDERIAGRSILVLMPNLGGHGLLEHQLLEDVPVDGRSLGHIDVVGLGHRFGVAELSRGPPHWPEVVRIAQRAVAGWKTAGRAGWAGWSLRSAPRLSSR